MKRAIVLFAAVGGLGVPIASALLGWAAPRLAPEVAARLPDVQLLLWPMSRMFADDRAGRHWFYLPLAALLSNALIYAAVGALSAWGRTFVPAFVVALAVAACALVGAQQAFGTSLAGLALALALALSGLVLHHRAARASGSAPRASGDR